MEKKIKISNNRVDVENALVRLEKPNGEESLTYVLRAASPIIRSSYENGKLSIKIEDCCTIEEGKFLKAANAVVKNISHNFILGHIITFEKEKNNTENNILNEAKLDNI